MRVTIKRLRLTNLPVPPGEVLASIHSLDEIGNLKSLIGSSSIVVATEEIEWDNVVLETPSAEVAIVVHSVSNGPIGYCKISIDTDLFTSTISSPVVTNAPTFSVPLLEAQISSVPSVIFKYIPDRVFLRDLRVSPPQRTIVWLQMDLIEGSSKLVATVKTDSLDAVRIVHYLALKDIADLSVNLSLSRGDIDRLRADIFVCEKNEDDEPKLTLIDSIGLKRLRMNDPVMVGTCGEGQLVLLFTSQLKASRIIPINDALYLQKRHRQFENVTNRSFKVSFNRTIPGHTVTCHLVAFGFDSLLVPDPLGAWLMDSEILIGPLFVGEAAPVISVTVRDKPGELVGLYSVPLVRSDLTFPSESLTISVVPVQDENSEAASFPVPSVSRPFSGFPEISEYSTARIRVCVDSAVKLPKTGASVFVAVSVVTLSVPPVVLTVSEVQLLQPPEDRSIFYRLGKGITVTREMTRNPFWYHTMDIDVYQWIKTDWLYCIVYDNSKQCEAIGHTCVQLGNLATDLSLPLTDPVTCLTIPSSYLKLSFPTPPTPWGVIHITQPLDQLVPIEGEVCLGVSVFSDSLEDPVTEGHHWLPISPIYPLIFHKCPPSGTIRLSLSLLNGTVAAKSKYKLTSRDCDIGCGGIRFRLTHH